MLSFGMAREGMTGMNGHQSDEHFGALRISAIVAKKEHDMRVEGFGLRSQQHSGKR